MEEIWRAIRGYEGYYEVSDKCRVRTVEHQVNHPHRGTKTVRSRIKKLNYHKDGRPFVELSKEGLNKKFPVYRLMAIAFLPNPNNLREINHKDENPSNNSLDNLEWCDRTYNINYGTRTARSVETKKRPILALRDNTPFVFFSSSQEAAEVLGVSVSLISMAIHGKGRARGFTFQIF